MEEKVAYNILISAFFLLGVLLGFVIGVDTGVERGEEYAAKTSCAQYNPTTGKFEWLEVIE